MIQLYAALALLAAMDADTGGAAGKVMTNTRGEYLANISGCGDCHTPLKMGPKGPEPDMSRRFAGHPAGMKMPPVSVKGPWMWVGSASNTAFAGPWGVTYAANITPDKDTGLGKWTAEDFIKAIRNGKHAGVGREIQPPMPWQAYAQMTDGDLRSLFEYLQSVPAIKNRVPDYQAPAAASSAPVSATPKK